jgi:hypothetical protein
VQFVSNIPQTHPNKPRQTNRIKPLIDFIFLYQIQSITTTSQNNKSHTHPHTKTKTETLKKHPVFLMGN